MNGFILHSGDLDEKNGASMMRQLLLCLLGLLAETTLTLPSSQPLRVDLDPQAALFHAIHAGNTDAVVAALGRRGVDINLVCEDRARQVLSLSSRHSEKYSPFLLFRFDKNATAIRFGLVILLTLLTTSISSRFSRVLLIIATFLCIGDLWKIFNTNTNNNNSNNNNLIIYIPIQELY